MHWLDAYHPLPGRFVVFEVHRGCGGLGDRVFGLVSACVLALLTNRHFRVVWDDPIPLTEAWRPRDPRLPWDRGDFNLAACSTTELLMVDRWKSMRGLLRDTAVLQTGREAVVVEANEPFFLDLLENPFFEEALSWYHFPPPAKLFSELLALLFTPSPELARALRPYLQQMLGQSFVGVQIRTLWNWGDGGGAVGAADLERFLEAVTHLLTRKTGGIFVSADDSRAIDIVREWFSERNVIALPHSILHVDRSIWTSLDDYRATFMNVHLLAACDQLVISHWSNLGRLAAFWGAKRPWITKKAVCDPPGPTIGKNYRVAKMPELLSKDRFAPHWVARTARTAAKARHI